MWTRPLVRFTAGIVALALSGCLHESEEPRAPAAPASGTPAPEAGPPAEREEGLRVSREAGGAPAKREEGRVGKREARRDPNAPGVASGQGLAGRGSGLGGGGTAEGLGGLGARGMGSGASGYGSGGVGFVWWPPHARDGAGGDSFADHGVNGFVNAAEDRVSTFSVDVDTGSYAIGRRKLLEGVLPPPAAVRVEEFVNYFHYGYAAPADRPFAVHAELAVHPFAAGHHLLRVGLAGRELPTANRSPLHLTFLVDVSGSMRSPDRLPLAQRALHYLVDNLGPEDTVALATYAGEQRRVLQPTPTTRRLRIHVAIDSLSSGGGTAMESGMAMAYDMASEAFLAGAENRVIVLSDGDANIGGSSHEQILDTIGAWAGKGITLSTIGFGTGNYKDTTMEQLADKGDGNYAYVDSMDEAKKVFGTDLAGTLRTIARDVKVQVDFDPAVVQSYRLLGYENRDIADVAFRDDAVDAGEVGSGHQVTALYELVLTEGGAGGADLGKVQLRAKPPGEDQPAQEWSVPVHGRPVAFDAASRDTRFAFGVASFAEILRRSPYATEVDLGGVARILARAAEPEREEHAELLDLVERADNLAAGLAAN